MTNGGTATISWVAGAHDGGATITGHQALFT